jgi:pre-mRNA-splicing factor ISY1
MARNEEKAHSVLNRWLELQKEDAGIATKKKKRPYLATLVDNVEEAEKWRRDLLKDVGSKVMQIQNGSLNTSFCSAYHSVRQFFFGFLRAKFVINIT